MSDSGIVSIAKYRKVGFFVVCALLAIAAFILILPFWQAIAWGAALSILVHPIHRRLNERFNDSLSAGITTTLTLLFIFVPLGLIGLALLGEVSHVRSQIDNGTGENFITQAIKGANEQLQPIAQRFGFTDFDLNDLVKTGLDNLKNALPRIVGGVIQGVITFTFALLLLFFILRDGFRLHKPGIELIPLPPARSEEILRNIYHTVHAVFFGIVLVALMQGSVLGLTFWILGLPAPLLWAMATVVLCTIPFAGAPIVWIPAALLLVSQAAYGKAIALALIGMFVIGLIDNVFRPIIIGARIKLHPMAVFFAIFGGIVTLGPVGILVGPVLLSVTLGAIEVLREIARTGEPTLNVDDGRNDEGTLVG